MTLGVVLVPLIGLAAAVAFAWGSWVNPLDLGIAAVLYVATGLGVTVGFHRLFTHRSFTACPALRASLAILGSMAFQGELIGWVALHRRHHALADQPGDPHSPYEYGGSGLAPLRGLFHAHVGWLLRGEQADSERYAPDLLKDKDIRTISRLFVPLSVLSLALPFGLGWLFGDGIGSALTALLWGGLVRIALLQHVTWSVNSLCHVVGRRPFRTRGHDRATNLRLLSVVSLGDSWHNAHHAFPGCARHGVDAGQADPSAALIKLFERCGWATDVRWPDASRLDRLRTHVAAPGVDTA
ncbi:MAG: acyl-CoA desaturase [Actinomycetota bacterium]|nr:MAG: acyl-CoA desaturase [Actinomycetota bacterium]